MSAQKLPAQLREREKELACVYRLSRVLTAQHPVTEIVATVADTVREALSHPELAIVRVRLDDVEAVSTGESLGDTTDGVSPCKDGVVLSAPINTTRDRVGELRVCYPPRHADGTDPDATPPQLLEHERYLLEAVATLLADNGERRHAIDDLEEAVAAENRKTVALEEVLTQVEELRKRNLDEIRTTIEAEILPVLSRLEGRLREEPEHSLLMTIRRSLQRLGSHDRSQYRTVRNRLSPREFEIAGMVASGVPTKQIAEILNLAPATVERHRHSIRRKLGIRNESINLATYLRTDDVEGDRIVP